MHPRVTDQHRLFRYAIVASTLLAACLTSHIGIRGADPVIDLGSNRELFADQFLIDRLDRAELRLGQPRDEGIVFEFDKPWEGLFCGYATVIRDGETYRLYYRGMHTAGSDGSNEEVTCYAESADGIHWSRPSLGLFEVSGTKDNNVILANHAPLSHNFCPMLDTRPDVPAEERYKALAGTRNTGLVPFASADGIRWKKLRDEGVITEGAFDSQNVPMWSPSENCYVCYFRVFADGIRRIARTTSTDFVNWSKPVMMGYGDKPNEHLYTNQTHPYFRAPQIYVAIAARFLPGRRVLSDEQAQAVGVHPKYFNDCSDGIFMTTRGSDQYDRTFMDGFLRPGLGLENWVSRTNYPALNVVPTGPTEMSFYANQNYGQPSAHLRRYSLRTDGFASVHAGYDGGELITKPFKFDGKQLSLNFATSAAGGIRVEIQDVAGKAIPNYTLTDAQETIGNEVDRVARWKSGSDLSALAGKPIRLRFELKDADLYSLQFVQ